MKRTLPSRTRLSAVLSVCALFAACADDAASDTESPDALRAEAAPAAAAGDITPEGMFPPPKPGYTRFYAAVMKDLKPGTDTLRCQYVQAPLDHDLDILGVEGYQSEGGAWQRLGDSPEEPGSEMRPCGNYLTHAVCNWMVSVDDPNGALTITGGTVISTGISVFSKPGASVGTTASAGRSVPVLASSARPTTSTASASSTPEM